MTLLNISRELQSCLEEGVLTIVIYKKGRKWFYKFVEVDEIEEEILKKFQNIDCNSFLMNGHDSLATYSLKAISSKIKYYYNN